MGSSSLGEKLFWPLIVGIILLAAAVFLQNNHEIQLAGQIETEPTRTLIPIGATNATTPATMIHGYRFRINHFDQVAGAAIPEEEPLRIDANELIPGLWYDIHQPTFQVKPGEITKLPIEIYHSRAKHAQVDVRVLYGPDPNNPQELPIDGVEINLRPRG